MFAVELIGTHFKMFMSKPLNPHPPPPGVTDNSSVALSILATNGSFIPLVTIVTISRVYTKFFMARHLFLDDCKWVRGGGGGCLL